MDQIVEYGLRYKYLLLKEPDLDIENAKKIVILIHGYGSDSEAMSVMPEAINIPNAVYIIPEGPEVCKGNEEIGVEVGHGRQWFDLTNFNVEEISGKLANEVDHFKFFISQISDQYKIPTEKIAIFGFSQGAFMASHLAMEIEKIAGSVSSSGGVFANVLSSAKRSENPIVLTHGTEDKVLSHEWSEFAYEKLAELNDNVSLYLIADGEHFIDSNAVKIIKSSLHDMLD